MQTFTPQNWHDYELLDCGNFEKLERFGSVILRRPEPQALWDKVWDEIEWKKLTDITFRQNGSHNGEWINPKKKPTKWHLQYQNPSFNLKFNLSLTSFKHVGIFPEQAANWDYIYDNLKPIKDAKFLNLFAYTGGASIAAKAAGADVTHVDSVKQVISWSKENMEASKLDNIRWVVEDAMKYVKREVKRGKTYHGIILDPPAYGIGANGERWQLEDNINELLKDIALLLDTEEHFLILNVYSLGLSALLVQNLVQQSFKQTVNLENGELYLQAKSGVQLPLGILARYHFKK
ncbi:MAG: class I SAM-dependent methyltransferase [Bacteroidia bacterium]|nr:class I SAM-dependent methyltransferase [Bacteroidia bacterium]MCF8445645.1 class I SAM-dependent methyltransferase [Bacteroidia bacterium]